MKGERLHASRRVATDTIEGVDHASRCRQRDWVHRPWQFVLVWGTPFVMLVGAVAVISAPVIKGWVGFGALLWMGVACLVNANRCGRRHCRFTGPFFVVMALAAAFLGYNPAWLGPNGWWWLLLTVVVGGGFLWDLPERWWGRYTNAGY